MFLFGLIPIFIVILAGFIGFVPGATAIIGLILGVIAILVSLALVPVTKSHWHYIVTLFLFFIQLVLLNELTRVVESPFGGVLIKSLIYVVIFIYILYSYNQKNRNP